MFDELGLGHRRIGIRLHDRDRHLAEALVVHPEDHRIQHGRVAQERDPNRLRLDLEPAAQDRLVGAPEDPEEAVVVEAGEVGGADPL